MTTARDIVKNGLQKIGVLRKGEAPDADEAADGLVALNDMLGTWSNESLLCVARVRESFTLTPSTAAYTIGTGQTFNTERPMLIISAFVREGISDYPLEIISDERYATIGNKSTAVNIPQFLNYNNGYAAGTITLAPVPSVANTLHIYSEKQITQIASLDTTIDFPPGWADALKWNFAVRVSPEYGIPLTAELKDMADQSLGGIKRAVLKNRPLNYEPEMRGIYNFNGDTWS